MPVCPGAHGGRRLQNSPAENANNSLHRFTGFHTHLSIKGSSRGCSACTGHVGALHVVPATLSRVQEYNSTTIPNDRTCRTIRTTPQHHNTALNKCVRKCQNARTPAKPAKQPSQQPASRQDGKMARWQDGKTKTTKYQNTQIPTN